MPSTRSSSRPRADAAPPPCMPPLSTFQEVVLLLDASRTQVNTWSSLAAGAQAFCAILAACAPLRAARLRVTTFASTSTDVYVGPVRGAASNVDYDHAPSPGPAAPLDALVRALRKSPSSAPKLLVLVSGACVVVPCPILGPSHNVTPCCSRRRRRSQNHTRRCICRSRNRSSRTKRHTRVVPWGKTQRSTGRRRTGLASIQLLALLALLWQSSSTSCSRSGSKRSGGGAWNATDVHSRWSTICLPDSHSQVNACSTRRLIS
jgi:hypothetical protein